MNRGRSSAQIVLCFLAVLLLAIIGCSGNDSPPQTYNISGAVTGATAVTINLTGAAIATTTTDASGNYSFTGRANGTYTVTPVKAGYVFTPVSLVAPVSGASVTGRDFVATATGASTYIISGTVSGAASSGVTITLTGDNTGSVATGVGGTYSISGLVPGSYTVTPSLTGFTFSPTSSAVTITAANSTANNFVATAIPVAHKISGTVTALGIPLSGVTITVTGTATTTAITNASGVFNVTGLYDGGYTLTPSKSGYTFSPVSLAATVSGFDLAGKDFTANLIPVDTYTISGTVSGAVLSGVTISLSGSGTGSTITNTSGNYSFPPIANGNYTVTPSLAGYTFNPTDRPANVIGANVIVPSFVATANPTTFTQADLTGTWRVNMLTTGTKNQWIRGRLSIDGSGNVSCVSMSNSTDVTGCPVAPLDWRMTINASGVITETGADSAENGHMTMTSNKNFVAYTGTGGSPSYHLATMQKEVTGTVYSNADMQSKSFVYHHLQVGTRAKWGYGTGTTNGSGAINISSETDPSGTTTPGDVGVTISIDGNGVATMTGIGVSTYSGFLSDDKKTIVGTITESDGGILRHRLMIIQITEQTYTAGPLPAGTLAAHMLAVGAPIAPFWVHFTATVASGGLISFSDWVSSNSGVTAPGTTTGHISSSGTLTITGNTTYHGQISDDGKFTVATQTLDTGVYALQVTTK